MTNKMTFVLVFCISACSAISTFPIGYPEGKTEPKIPVTSGGDTPSEQGLTVEDVVTGLSSNESPVTTRGRNSDTRERKKIILPIHFEFGSAEILPSSREPLMRVGKAIQSPILASADIEIAAHTDNVGSRESNQKLSTDRANSVKNFLMNHCDIASTRLKAKGYGEDKPIASNKTEEGRAKNRRVELIKIN